MKKRKMIEAMNLIKDEYIAEATPGTGKKTRGAWRRYVAIAACLCLLIASVNVWLFLPYDKSLPDVSRYADSEYYPLIQRLNEVTYRAPSADNNYDAYFSSLFNEASGGAQAPTADPDGAGPADALEITDNQVAGVIEADIIKRSEHHIFYLSGTTLLVYSIDGEDSRQVGSFTLQPIAGLSYRNTSDCEMYLSSDCKTVIIVTPCYPASGAAKTAVIALDVSNPTHIREKGYVTISGSYHSSRLTNGELLLFSEFRVYNNPDFSQEELFVPQIDTGNGEQSMAIDEIIYPEKLASSRYLVACKLAEDDLSLRDSMAFLSYSEVLYVSGEHIYATRPYTDSTAEEGSITTEAKTDITCVSYGGEKLDVLGTVTVSGTVLNQYSMDEYNGMLRVVTTTNRTLQQGANANTGMTNNTTVSFSQTRSADLYCIDLASWQIAASVTGFAPEGESVQSVRFDGTSAYVCTAILIESPSDPVFFFNLQDISHITYKDTGTIAGYSHSLVDLRDGYLLGIGVGDEWGTFKIEIYEETETGVASVCNYTVPYADFSTNYKAYYIDREHLFFGFGITAYDGYEAGQGSRYILLSFDGYELHELVNIPLSGSDHFKRSVYIDGYLYALAPNDMCVVDMRALVG